MTNEKNKRINARLNEGQMEWYKNQSKVRNVKLSKLLQMIPDIIHNLEEQLDTKESYILELKEQINGFEVDSDGYREFKEMFDKPKTKG